MRYNLRITLAAALVWLGPQRVLLARLERLNLRRTAVTKTRAERLQQALHRETILATASPWYSTP